MCLNKKKSSERNVQTKQLQLTNYFRIKAKTFISKILLITNIDIKHLQYIILLRIIKHSCTQTIFSLFTQ